MSISTLESIVVDQTECNPTQLRKKDSKKSKLQTIGGIPIAWLTMRLMISFCNHVNIKKMP